MRRLALSAALLAAACAGPKQAELPQPLPPPSPVSVLEVKDPNFEAIVVESVGNEEADFVTFTKIFVDGKEAGKTVVGLRSQEKHARLKLPIGNQPVRLEHWFLPAVGEWTVFPETHQPRERFVRIEEGTIARLILRYDPAGRPSLTLSREPEAPH